MPQQLLERDGELAALGEALDRAIAGQGSVVVILGEAGIGKTSVLRSFMAQAKHRARVLSGACDDLMTPRTLGAIRDAAAAGDGPLATALATGDRDHLLTALREELSDRARPTVLVVEDVHWADDATVDVLRYLSRRITELPAMLLISFREDEVARDHPAHRLIGALGGQGVHRLRLSRLSRAGVARLAGGTAATSAPLYHLTGGNPFFLSEVLAARGDDSVPLTVVDAVLGRVHLLDPATQSALEQLAIIPSRVELALARTLLGDLTVLAPAERRGILEVTSDAVAFRHELSRRAVEGSLPASERMQLNGRVLEVLRGRDHLDLPRIVHHAVQAGEDDVVVEFGSRAAEQAAAAGAHRQEIRFYEEVLARSQLVAPALQAAILQRLTESLFLVGRMDDALTAGHRAILILERQGATAAVGEVLSEVAPIYWVTARSADALATGHRSVDLLRADGQSPRLVFALLYLCLLMTATGQLEGLESRAEEAFGMAESVGVPDLIALSHTVRGRSAVLRGDRTGLADMRLGLAAAISAGNHVFAIISYVVLVQDLWDLGEFDEVEHVVEEGLDYTREREMDFYVKHLTAHQAKLQALRGHWTSAEATLRDLVGARTELEPGSLRYALPDLALLAGKRGTDDAAELMDWCEDFAERAGGYYDIVPAALVAIESAWLSGRPERARAPIQRILRYEGRGLQTRHRAEVQRWLHRLGQPQENFPDCPDVFAAGLRGDWRAAAGAWQRERAPYHQAMELLDSGDVEATMAALRIFDSLGAGPALQIARRRLRYLGVSQVPRGPQPTTRANPAGLTDRQVEILTMLSSGSTNAEIAARLVVSVRTVDHHVSAVLQKLGLTSRRQAAKAAATLGLAPSRENGSRLAPAAGH
jgi:ATP/maltotriose-dependent transcriptional regulator MalT